MAQTGTKVAGGFLAGLVVVGGFVAREAGVFADDAARVGTHVPVPHVPEPPRLPRAPDPVPQRLPGAPAGSVVVHIPDGSTDALFDPLVSASIKEAITLVRKMAKGDADERAVAKAACKVLSVATDNEPPHANFKSLITGQVRTDNGFVNAVQDRYAEKIADALTIAHDNARAGLWYVQYCLRP